MADEESALHRQHRDHGRDEERTIDNRDVFQAAAVLVAESERLRESLARVETELATTRQVMRVMAEDRHRVFGIAAELVQLVRDNTEDTGTIREVVERIDGLITEHVLPLADRLKGMKVPRWLQGMIPDAAEVTK